MRIWLISFQKVMIWLFLMTVYLLVIGQIGGGLFCVMQEYAMFGVYMQ